MPQHIEFSFGPTSTTRKKPKDFVCNLKSVQCSFTGSGSQQCRRKTVMGIDLCHNHLLIEKTLVVKRSVIQNERIGLFAAHPKSVFRDMQVKLRRAGAAATAVREMAQAVPVFEKGDTICIFKGEPISHAEALRRYTAVENAPYLLMVRGAARDEARRDDTPVYLDFACARSYCSLANVSKKDYNAHLVVREDTGAMTLVARENILHHQEIIAKRDLSPSRHRHPQFTRTYSRREALKGYRYFTYGKSSSSSRLSQRVAMTPGNFDDDDDDTKDRKDIYQANVAKYFEDNNTNRLLSVLKKLLDARRRLKSGSSGSSRKKQYYFCCSSATRKQRPGEEEDVDNTENMKPVVVEEEKRDVDTIRNIDTVTLSTATTTAHVSEIFGPEIQKGFTLQEKFMVALVAACIAYLGNAQEIEALDELVHLIKENSRSYPSYLAALLNSVNGLHSEVIRDRLNLLITEGSSMRMQRGHEAKSTKDIATYVYIYNEFRDSALQQQRIIQIYLTARYDEFRNKILATGSSAFKSVLNKIGEKQEELLLFVHSIENLNV